MVLKIRVQRKLAVLRAINNYSRTMIYYGNKLSCSSLRRTEMCLVSWVVMDLNECYVVHTQKMGGLHIGVAQNIHEKLTANIIARFHFA